MNQLSELSGSFNGERIFLIGNGPSLENTPLKKLQDEYSLAMNMINLIYPDTTWRPSFYYYGNDLESISTHAENDSTISMIQNNIDDGVTCFLNSELKPYLNNHRNVHYVDKFSLFGSNPLHKQELNELESRRPAYFENFWSDNISDLIFHYHTMYGAIQIAAFLGFDEIYLLGCDLGLEYRNPHMIFKSGLDPYRYDKDKFEYLSDAVEDGTPFRSLVNGAAMKLISRANRSDFLEGLFTSDSRDHFNSNYLSNIEIIDGPRAESEIKKGHYLSKMVSKNRGFKISNATPGGNLEVYGRVDLSDIV